MGFSHRVYKNMDPRAAIMRETCHEVLTELGLETIRSSSWQWRWKNRTGRPYFIEAQAVPERRFLPGIVLSAIGIPVSMFTRSCAGPYRGLDLALDRNDCRSGHEDRPSASAVHRCTNRDYVALEKRK